VTRCLEIVSEASRRLPASVRDRHPDLPWRAIMDVGNVLRHEYDNVSQNRVWRTVQERLPQLLVAIESEIAALPRPLPADDRGAEPQSPERDVAAEESPEPGEGPDLEP
jgi:Ribonuclease HepT-like